MDRVAMIWISQHALDGQLEDDVANEDHGQQDDGQGQVGVDLQISEEAVDDIHRHHQVVGVGEVHQLHNAENERQANADQGINAAHQQAGNDALKEWGHGQVSPFG